MGAAETEVSTHTKSRVKRKLFDDDQFQCNESLKVHPNFEPSRLSRWSLRAVRNETGSEDDEPLEIGGDWPLAGDEEEPEKQHQQQYLRQQHFHLQQPHLEQRLVCGSSDDQDRFKWLLNFNVDSLFHDLPLAVPVDQQQQHNAPDHDHNYRAAAIAHHQRKKRWAAMGNSELLHEQILRGKKPPYTYTELIEFALNEEGQLTVSGIYKWIVDHFPFFKATDDRWKNSVRHNLSINANFKKGHKVQGSSHLWRLATMTEKKRKQDLMNNTTKNQWKKKKTDTGITILDKIERTKRTNSVSSHSSCSESLDSSIQNGMGSQHSSPSYILPSPQTSTLAKIAEEIMNGEVEKKVEVQLLTPLRPLAYTFLLQSPEFLNPLSRKEAVRESGLLDEEEGHYQAVHSLPQQILNSICSDIDTSAELFQDELASFNFTPQELH